MFAVTFLLNLVVAVPPEGWTIPEVRTLTIVGSVVMTALALGVLVLLAARGPVPRRAEGLALGPADRRRRLAGDHDRGAIAVPVWIVVGGGHIGARRIGHARDRERDGRQRVGELAFETEQVPFEAVLHEAVPPADQAPVTVTPLTVA